MAAADVQAPPAEPTPALPDYLTDPDAVLKDSQAKWRYGRAPDYSKTRKVFSETKKMNHTAGSLPELVQNLVKNWEVEASFKPELKDWRTIDHANYSFAINGGPPQDAEHMLKVGTYNAIIAPNEYYSPVNSDFATSHKTFKRMMPTFAWEVLEVYSGPPHVAFRWRHWGVMKNDYVGFNDKGEKVTAKAHGGAIDIEGVTVAKVNEAVQLQSVETWFDPLEMFRQIAPNGVVNKLAVPKKVDGSIDLQAPEADQDAPSVAETSTTAAAAAAASTVSASQIAKSAAAEGCPFMQANKLVSSLANAPLPAGHPPTSSSHPPIPSSTTISSTAVTEPTSAPAPVKAPESKSAAPAPAPESVTPTQLPKSIYSSTVNGSAEADPNRTLTEENAGLPKDSVDAELEKPAAQVHPFPHTMEQKVAPAPGDAIVAPADSAEAKETKREMQEAPKEGDVLLNKE